MDLLFRFLMKLINFKMRLIVVINQKLLPKFSKVEIQIKLVMQSKQFSNFKLNLLRNQPNFNNSVPVVKDVLWTYTSVKKSLLTIFQYNMKNLCKKF